MDSDNEQKWITFFSSIDHFKKLPTRNSKIEIDSSIECLSLEFANKLSQRETEKKGDLDVSKNQTETPIIKNINKTIDNMDELTGPQACRKLFSPDDDTDDDVNDASAKLADANIKEESHRLETLKHIEALVDNKPLASGKSPRKRHRSKDTPSKKIFSCEWTISIIADYFIFDKCVTKLKLPIAYAPCTITKERAKIFIFRRLEMVKGIDLKTERENANNKSLIQLKSVTGTEAGSRLVLDALLILLCSTIDDLQIELEKTITCDSLPSCTFDYCIRKGERIIGCVEAKSVKCLKDSSVAQAVLQLMMLQANLIATEKQKVTISKFPVFAILSDGHRFIFIQLKGSSLGFEHDEDKLKIRRVIDEGDFIDILQHITFLVKEFKALSEDDAILTD